MCRLLFLVLLLLVPASAVAMDQSGSGRKPLPEGMERPPLDEETFNKQDPWEPFNRYVFAFNEIFDGYVAKPVARGYQWITPDPINTGITNFFTNLGEVSNITNSLLQGKGESALNASGRFALNSTFGLAGFFDVAGRMSIPSKEEDFGQTLGYWGVGQGPYTVLPFLGPSTVRDTVGMGADFYIPDAWDLLDSPENIAANVVYVVDLRASLLRYEDQVTGDRYTFLRNTYLQRRQYEVNDGVVEDDPFAAEGDEDLMLDDF